ncbi:MAG: CHASE2 domain-containing protein [Acidobacteriota bacterium]|nr:CHASE2 domain-containing protein [Acidobacteriota bacterium]
MTTTNYFTLDQGARNRPRRLLPAIWALAFTLIPAVLGFIPLLDDLLSDRALTKSNAAGSSRLLLVQSSPDRDQPVDWSQLVDHLQTSGAKIIVFPFIPEADRAFFQRAAQSGNVLFGRPLLHRNGRPFLAPLPPRAADLDLHSAIASLPAAPGRLAKYQQITYRHERSETPSIEAWTARAAGVSLPKRTRFRIDFSPASLPNVTMDHVLNNRMPATMVQDKIVIVGNHTPPEFRARDLVRVPGSRSVSTAAFHAYSLHTLLEGRIIRELPIWATAGLVTLIVSVLALFSQFLYIRPVSRILAAAHLLVLGAAWLGPALLSVHPPAAELLTALAAFTFLTIYSRYSVLIDSIRQYRLDFGELVRGVLPPDRPSLPATERKEHVDDRMFTAMRCEALQLEEHLRAASTKPAAMPSPEEIGGRVA